MHTSARLCAALGTAAMTTSLIAFSTYAGAAPATRSLPGSVPAWAVPAHRVGTASPDATVGFRVYLTWRGGSSAEDFARSVSTPGSANYGKFLSSAQFRTQFAPSASDASSVQQWLRKSGFTVDYTPGNNRYVQAEGTVAQASAAFGSSFGEYTISGKTLRSPDSTLSVPASLPSSVAGVVGLDESSALITPSTKPNATPSPAFVNAPPCSNYWAEKLATGLPNPYGAGSLPYVPCGYTPAQLRGAYGLGGVVSGQNDGAGQTVAIIDAYASPTIVQDVNQWSANRGIPQLGANQFRQVTPPGVFNRPQNNRQDPQGWYGEETLDVEAVHGMAPGANIVYVGAPNNYQDLDAAMNHVVDNHLASIVTNSYGFSSELLPPGYVKPFNDTLIQAAATGIGAYFSSGDNGDETFGDPSAASQATPDWPAVSPWVTAVGGTSLAVGASNNYLFETGWETANSNLNSAGTAWTPTPPGTYLYGSGGGTSRLFAQPSYQAGVVPNSIATKNGDRPRAMRTVPDVAAVGDPQTGLLIGQTQSFPDGTVKYSEYRLGGTSLSSPLFAGMMAVAQQAAGETFGFANPLFYSKAGSFTDVVPPASTVAVVRVNYNNSVDASNGISYRLRTMNYDAPLTIHTAPGYDDVTGLGSMNSGLFAALTQ